MKIKDDEGMKTNDSFVLRNIYGKNILMPVRTNSASNDPILLNDIAAHIWNIASDGLKIDEILKNIAHCYNLKPESSELIAVNNFIEQMISMGLLIIPNEEE